MTVHFIGAGPGAADLLTLRGRDLIARCPVCLYAGSIVPRELLAHCPAGTRLIDTAPMTLDQIEAEFVAAHAAGLDVARLQSGDLSVYSALAEQIRRLERRGIPYTVTPGVPAFAAAAAALGVELTVPEVAQSVVLTRMPGRASRMPESERLVAFAATKRNLTISMMSSLGGKNAEVVSSCSAMIREAVVPLLARAQQAGEIRPDVDVSDLLKMSHAISVACEYPSSHPDQAHRLLAVMLDGLRHGASLDGASLDGTGPDRTGPDRAGPAGAALPAG